MTRTTIAEMRNAFENLKRAWRTAGMTEEIGYRSSAGSWEQYAATADDLVLSEGSATYGNSWGVWLSPWHNPVDPQRWDGASAHYTPRGLGALSTDRATAYARMRAYADGLDAATELRTREARANGGQR